MAYGYVQIAAATGSTTPQTTWSAGQFGQPIGTGSSDGTTNGTTCNIGAWDGTVTQIGCDFAT